MTGIVLMAAIVSSVMTMAALIDTILEDCEEAKVKWVVGLFVFALTYLFFAGLFVTIAWVTHFIK